MNRLFRTISFLVLFLAFTTKAIPVYAQAPTSEPTQEAGWYDQGYAESIESAQQGDVNAAAHVSNVNTNNYSDTVRRILGPIEGITTTETGMTPNNKRMLSQSAVYNIENLISSMYVNPPASTYAFVQDLGQTLGFIPKSAYAQGAGFSGLSALLPVWKAFRNISYLFLAIVMTVIGFMVMFRKKIDPKTVVTVQNALPRIVMTLILITFSYAIVGLMIDLMYVLIAICIGVFQSTGMMPADFTPNKYVAGSLLGAVFGSVNAWDIIWRILGIKSTVGGNVGALAIGGIMGTIAATGGTASVLIGIAALVIGLSGLLFAALVSLAMLLLSLRLFVFFLGTYIKIILALIFAPLQLMMGAMPGNDAFGSWFKNLVSNILVFPAAAAMFLLATLFMELSNTAERIWAPPYVGFASVSATSIGALVALGILFAIPNVGKQIQEALKSKGGMAAGLEGVTGAFSGPTQIGMQVFQYWQSHQQMKQLGDRITNQGGGGGGGAKPKHP